MGWQKELFYKVKVAVVGTGYVGLVTGTCFAEMGNQVTCVDIDESKVSAMRNGQIPIYEPGLEKMFHDNINQGRLKFSTDLAEGIAGAAVIFLALPTPPNEDGSADLSYILDVAEKLGPLLRDYVVVINKSTVPVGTAEQVKAVITKTSKSEFDVVSNPEFLREGCAVEDFIHPDRIVIGCSSNRARQVMASLYEPFSRSGDVPIIWMDERSAEITKYAANSFLASKISFMNEIANLCKLLGADVDNVRTGIGSDKRIGSRFLFPGIGYGGSCFPKDVQALQRTAKDAGYTLRTIEALIEVNEQQKRRLFERLKAYYKDLSGKTFALWGLSYKPETDDIREAPSIYLIDDLLAAGASVRAYDPEAMENMKRYYANNQAATKLSFSDDQYQALDGSDALLVVTEWSSFQEPDFEKIANTLSEPAIFDGRNMYSLNTMREQGFYYDSIGRPTIEATKSTLRE